MRILHVIFSLYLVAISLLPCTDIADKHEHSDHVEYAHSEHGHEDCDQDTCPPFCSCNCCGVTVMFFHFEPISLQPTVSYNKVNPIYIQESFLSINHTIWQPPKI